MTTAIRRRKTDADPRDTSRHARRLDRQVDALADKLLMGWNVAEEPYDLFERFEGEAA